MLRSLKILRGYTILAKDGNIGKVYDFYFHDDTWIIRYLVVDTGHWLPERKVLLPPTVLGRPNWAANNFPVDLTRQQVEKSPEIDTDMPVSRQQETELHKHFGWPYYWNYGGPDAWPPFVPMAPVGAAPKPAESATEEKADPHLRSTKEVAGYHIHDRQGAVGHVEDFIVDDVKWVIRYLVVHTGKLPLAKKVLISPQWFGAINYAERTVTVTLSREKILNCPEFFPGAGVNREYEERLYDYYGRPTYWEDASPAIKAGKKAA